MSGPTLVLSPSPIKTDEVPNVPPSLSPYYTPPLLSRLPTALLASPLSLPFPAPPSSEQNTPTTATGIGYTHSQLPDIDAASLALHYALYKFRAVSDRYATLAYDEAFNWQDIHLPVDVEREWYIVAFRSKRHEDADCEQLYTADREAHEEAVTAGGLLLYWYGLVNENGENLATCIWQSRQAAIRANHNPKHAIAARLASATYKYYNLERYVLRKVKGQTGVVVEKWTGGEVGGPVV